MDLSLIVQQGVFFALATIVVIAALLVILVRNPVHSVLSLVLAFVASAGLWILLEAEFLGLILVLVYVGAVMTLFLFIVMMLKLNLTSLRAGFVTFLPLGVAVSLSMLIMLCYVVGPAHFGMFAPATPVGAPSNIVALGTVLYTQYAYPFEIAAVILLVALIAAIGLTFRGPRDRKRQVIEDQLLVKRSDRLRIIKMPSEKKGRSDL